MPTTAPPAGPLTEQIEALGWFIPAAQFFYLLTNRTRYGGSVPEAVRRVISLPNVPIGWTKGMVARLKTALGKEESGKAESEKQELPTCPAELRDAILRREREGKAIVPERISKAITRKVTRQVIETHRRPHEAGLKYLTAPGTSMMVRWGKAESGKAGKRETDYVFAKAGSILESDDGSINFPVCIPWAMGGNRCADRFGVIVGRFQWLRTIDVGTRYRPGWVFVARMRGSFRGADALTLLHGITLQHGIWEEYRFEQGVFKSDLVKNAIRLLGARLHTVYSPHSKPFIEGGFNQDWTKLSVHFPQCDLGRFRGDTEETNRVLQGCRAGQQDPRRIFPMMSDALKAFEAITAEENRTLVKSRNWGSWVPEERWSEQQSGNLESGKAANLRKLEGGHAFMFAPYAMTWTVRGMIVGGRVPIFEDMSVPFDFSAPWLTDWDGARVRVHFDPSSPKCTGVGVLAEDWQGHKAGLVLGPTGQPLEQVNETAGYVRLVMGWGNDDRSAGIRAKQQAAGAMRRELRTVMPGGHAGYAKSEEHDGLATVSTVERGTVESGNRESGKVETGQPALTPAPSPREREDLAVGHHSPAVDLDSRERAIEEAPLEFL
jgi:hypothetical protein